MSSARGKRSRSAERAVVGGAGVTGILGGMAAWVMVRRQLAGERITVPSAATFLAGRPVRGPLSAYAEAEFIRQATLRATDGRPYGVLPEEDPIAPSAREASLLRASLFTSILAFGVAAAGVAVGSVLLVVAAALPRRG